VWSDLDRHYAMFEQKDVDWKAAYLRYQPLARQATSMDALAPIVGQLFAELRDLHVDLQSPADSSRPFDPGPRTYVSIDTRNIRTFFFPSAILGFYTSGSRQTASKKINYGRIGQDIGYVWIEGFGQSGGWGGPEIDEALRSFTGVHGIVIDVRDNGGGSSENARAIAARFVEHSAVFAYTRYRNGPSHDDFTKFFPQRVEPEGVHQDVKTVVLTNRLSASAAEAFVLAARTNPKIVTVGDTTIGALGNPLVRELPRGWQYRFPEGMEVDAQKRSIENVGIAPDIYSAMDLNLLAFGRDSQLDKAIALIRQ
jgi:hypothetical protein